MRLKNTVICSAMGWRGASGGGGVTQQGWLNHCSMLDNIRAGGGGGGGMVESGRKRRRVDSEEGKGELGTEGPSGVR